ncbi:hypothetical protein AGOR_G00121680 [Albula goreensis]|uniref:Uncharacterized protein n=1 Tax=Albula goreensis TaxID=1534307 RepID=A0A8T3D909_9TELE|nr:hypothetical protein AGOR_G00121680 [Albula goreensis]
MGQVLGFSHCKEFGSVSSTPDSTPPCTDGGNEESDFPELQTAREWSEDEDGGEDDEGGTSSPSVWGTPRQNSFELTFSYIAFTEPEGGGASRRDSMGGGRRRGGARGSGRTALSRGSTEESLLPAESPELEWEHRTFLLGEEEEEGEEEGRERQAILSQQLPSLELRTQPPSQSSLPEPQNESVLSLELRTQPPSQSPPPEPQNQQLSTLELRTQPPSQSPLQSPRAKPQTARMTSRKSPRARHTTANQTASQCSCSLEQTPSLLRKLCQHRSHLCNQEVRSLRGYHLLRLPLSAGTLRKSQAAGSGSQLRTYQRTVGGAFG